MDFFYLYTDPEEDEESDEKKARVDKEFEFGDPANVSVESEGFEEIEGKDEDEFESFVEELGEEESQYAIEEDFFDTGTFQSEEQ